jgi:hypothetical protein
MWTGSGGTTRIRCRRDATIKLAAAAAALPVISLLFPFTASSAPSVCVDSHTNRHQSTSTHAIVEDIKRHEKEKDRNTSRIK